MIDISMHPEDVIAHIMSAARFALKALRGRVLRHPAVYPTRCSPLPESSSTRIYMAFPNRATDPEVAVASGEFVPAQHLPSLPRYTPDDPPMNSGSPPLLPMEKGLKILPYNSFLMPKGSQPVALPKSKRLSRWGRFQLWFNTYR